MIEEQIQGWFDFQEVYSMAADRVPSNGAVLVELGPWLGRSTMYLARMLKQRSKNARIYAVDTWNGSAGESVFTELMKTINPETEFLQNVKDCGHEDMIVPVKSDSIEASKQFNDIDFLFIDTTHTYNHLKSELIAWTPRLKWGAFYGGHDWAIHGIQKAVRELVPNYKIIGGSWCANKS